MAKKTTKNKLTKARVPTAQVQVLDALQHGENCMARYGRSVIEDRALVDYRDGLLPVQRRILYAAYKMGLTPNGSTKKSARLVGDVIGKYHPHGDSAAYDSAVKLVNSPMPYLYGQGNFGGMDRDNEPNAAMRYTEVRFTKYGYNNFFSPDHLAVSQMVPNYDGKEEEPMILPSLLPNLLLNGSYGIAVGITAFLPAFSLDGVIALTKKALRKEEITSLDCLKALECNYAMFGGGPCSIYKGDKETKDELRNLYKTGIGSAYIVADYEYDLPNKTIRIYSMPPMTNMQKTLQKVRDTEGVRTATDESSKDDPFMLEVVLNKELGGILLEETMDAIVEEHFVAKCDYKMNVIENSYNAETERVEGTLMRMGVIKFLEKWTKWRVELEVKALQYRKAQIQTHLDLQELMLLASQNIDTIMAGLKRKDTEDFIAKKLKITLAQVDTILSRQIRSLKALEQEKLKEKIKELGLQIKQIDAWIKKPSDKVIADIEAMAKAV